MLVADVVVTGLLAIYHEDGYTPSTAAVNLLVNCGGADNFTDVKFDNV
jgi:hypothetical protein